MDIFNEEANKYATAKDLNDMFYHVQFHQCIVFSRSTMLKKSEKRAQIQELALDLVIRW